MDTLRDAQWDFLDEVRAHRHRLPSIRVTRRTADGAVASAHLTKRLGGHSLTLQVRRSRLDPLATVATVALSQKRLDRSDETAARYLAALVMRSLESVGELIGSLNNRAQQVRMEVAETRAAVAATHFTEQEALDAAVVELDAVEAELRAEAGIVDDDPEESAA